MFSVIENIAEEESEDSETEIRKKLTELESLAPASSDFFLIKSMRLSNGQTQMNLGALHFELSSPPPEA